MKGQSIDFIVDGAGLANLFPVFVPIISFEIYGLEKDVKTDLLYQNVVVRSSHPDPS